MEMILFECSICENDAVVTYNYNYLRKQSIILLFTNFTLYNNIIYLLS